MKTYIQKATKAIILFFIILLIGLVIKLLFTLPTENYCKEYIIQHKSEIIKDTGEYASTIKNHYSINKYDGNYFTDISIVLLNDSSYSVIFWGNRTSFQWIFRLDKDFLIDIPYNNSKGINTKLDEEIIKILNEKTNTNR